MLGNVEKSCFNLLIILFFFVVALGSFLIVKNSEPVATEASNNPVTEKSINEEEAIETLAQNYNYNIYKSDTVEQIRYY
ncbi:MAG: hypothetical protein ACFB0B_03105 [Thermonemataceae bacterium]